MKLLFSLLLIVLMMTTVNAQSKLPYYEIPTASENYSAGAVVSRMLDALGFRYYWATEGLREKDLAFKPNDKGRNMRETITHLYDLSNMLLSLTKTKVTQSKEKPNMTFDEMRTQTLLNIKGISNRFFKSTDVAEFNVVRDGKIAVPFWNLINGPIADAIWHTGQVASFRRSSGNPINSKINHFSGTVKE
jgi:hypothetical protein